MVQCGKCGKDALTDPCAYCAAAAPSALQRERDWFEDQLSICNAQRRADVETIASQREQLEAKAREVRSWKIIAGNLVKAIYAKFVTESREFRIASSDVVCPECRLRYGDHPQIPEMPTFHAVCDGTVVKT